MKKLVVALAAMLTFTTTPFAAVGDLSTDLVFIPVTACRLVDTRYATNTSQTGVAANAPIAAGTSRGFWGWASNYPAQGGAGSGSTCGILQSSDVAAIAVNFTVVNPTTGGYITAWPFGTTQPLAATVNFNAGEVRGNFAVVKLNQATSSFDFSIYSTSTTHVVVDVVGYYAKPRP
jgi:hypothetical protein